MALISEESLERVKQAADIVEVVSAHTDLRRQGARWVGLCPFHEERTPSFSVDAQEKLYHCFGCGAHGTALGFLMDYEHLDFVEAVRQLASMVGLQVPQEAGESRSDYAPLYAVLEQAARVFRQALKDTPAAVTYLKGRGVNGEIAAQFGIGFAPAGWDTLLKALGSDDPGRQQLSAAGLIIRRDDGRYYSAVYRRRT